MNIERDKFLTEAMGEQWFCYDVIVGYEMDRYDFPTTQKPIKRKNTTNDFSTWSDFGKLWEWSQKQSWWKDLKESFPCWIGKEQMDCCWHTEAIINPDKFADIVYDYLKEYK